MDNLKGHSWHSKCPCWGSQKRCWRFRRKRSPGASSLEMGPRSSLLEGEFFRLFQEDAQRVASASPPRNSLPMPNWRILDSVSAKSESSSNLSDVSVNKIEVWTGDEDSWRSVVLPRGSFNAVHLNLHDLRFLGFELHRVRSCRQNYGNYVRYCWS